MKKYLFNKIKVDGDGVNFIPFRQASIAESFLANTNLSTNQKDWKFSPSSFKTFLKMLSKTKLAGNYEYNIKIINSEVFMYKLAIVGATGLVGRTILKILEVIKQWFIKLLN